MTATEITQDAPATQALSFEAHMEHSYRKVYNLAYRLTGNRSDAEDLTQEAFYRAYRAFHEYHGDRPFENWILRIVTRLYLDLCRSRRRRVQTVSYDARVRSDHADDALEVQTADDQPNPEEVLLTGTVSEPLERALASLKPDQRMLVMMADVEQRPYSEIADILSIPVGTVRSRLHRAHRKLRDAMEAAEGPTVRNPNGLRLGLLPG